MNPKFNPNETFCLPAISGGFPVFDRFIRNIFLGFTDRKC